MKMTVIGTGYLGATHAACMAYLGHEVLGVDSEIGKVEALNGSRAPFFEPGLDPLLHRHLGETLNFSDSYNEAANFANVHFLCVGTPQQDGNFSADISQLRDAVSKLVPLLRGHHTIIGKSTVPVGTAAELQKLADALCVPGSAIDIAWNPEFVREGFAVADTVRPSRIVVGQRPGSQAANIVREIYTTPLDSGMPFIVTDLATAELAKGASNAFLGTKISFANAMAEVCEAAGADVVQLTEIMGYDDRIGHKYLGSGLGFGGGCLPKDVRGFIARAGELGANDAYAFLREVDSINTRRRERMVTMITKMMGGTVLGGKIAILGCAFKPDTDDVRDSPALDVAGQLLMKGASVTLYDPQAMANARRAYPALSFAHSAEEAVAGADLVVYATDWGEFHHLKPHALRDLVSTPIIIDGRNALDPWEWLSAGWTYKAMGRNF